MYHHFDSHAENVILCNNQFVSLTGRYSEKFNMEIFPEILNMINVEFGNWYKLMAVVNFKVTLTSEGVNENIYAAGFLSDQSQTIYGCFVFRYCLRTLTVILASHLWLQYTPASMVRVPGLWSKGHWFKSLQDHWENFLLRGQLSVPTLILASAPPPLCYCSGM